MKISSAIGRAKTRLVVQHSFFGVLAWQMQYIECEAIRTMATNCSDRVFYSKRFFESLDTDGQCFGIAHELMHGINATLSRRGDRDFPLWNCATDFVINGMLVEAGFQVPALPSYLGEVSIPGVGKFDTGAPKILHDLRYRGMTCEKVYDELVRIGYKPSGWFDDHEYSVPTDPAQVEQASARMRRLFSEAIQQVGVGNTPLGIQRLYKDMCTPKIDWKSMLATVISGIKVDDYSFVPPDSAFFGSGITIPTLNEGQSLKAIVIIDTSGSIGDKDIAAVMAELRSIAAQFSSYELRAFCFDSVTYDVQEFSNDSDNLEFIRFDGGGGTDFDEALEKADQVQEDFDADVAIFFTDGYGGGWHEDKYAHKFKRMVWIINNASQVPTWGEHCVYDGHDI